MSEDLKTDNMINEEIKNAETQEQLRTEKHNPENEMNNTEGTEKKKKKTSWFFWVFISCLVLLASLFAAKVYLAAYKARPELYGRYFYNWRISSADEVMVKGESYKKLRLNTIDPKNTDALNFRKMAEEETIKVKIFNNDGKSYDKEVEVKGLLSFFKVSEHFPRGIIGHYTLVNKTDYDFYRKLLVFKAFCIMNLGKEALEKDHQNEIKVPILQKSRGKEENFPIDAILNDSANEDVKEAVKRLSRVIVNIYERRDGYVLKNKNSEAPPQLLKDINGIIDFVYPSSDAGKEKINDEEINKFFVNNGKVIKVRALQSLIYYNLYTIFYYVTLDVKLNEVPMDDKDRPYHIARMFAKIFSNVFSTPWDGKAVDIPWIEKFLGKKITNEYSLKKIQEKYKKPLAEDESNIKKLISRLKKYGKNK